MEKIFTIEDQLDFAKLSGDFNPLHIDPVYARRTMTGQTVVYGISAALWALNLVAEQVAQNLCLEEIKINFLKPMFVGKELTFNIENNEPNKKSINILQESNRVVKIDVTLSYSSNFSDVKSIIYKKKEPTELKVKDIENAFGNIKLGFDKNLLKKNFPYLADFFYDLDIATILATTQLVGMICPGLNSLYHELHLKKEGNNREQTLFYKVRKFDNRFNLVNIDVDAHNLVGNIKAFLRPKPQEQPSFSEILSKIDKKEFIGQKAIVIGGSRGLGEIIAKTLAAGGAEVFITYNQGENEATTLVDEIIKGNGKASAFKFDVLKPDNQKKINPTHLYYMATPFISSANRGGFCYQLFNNFCNYYVKGFYETLRIFNNANLKGVFYPSSVFVEEEPLDMSEYFIAKIAGEKMCAFLEKLYPNIKITCYRLPRMATDQTASLIPIKKSPAFPLIFDVLKEMKNKEL